MSTNQQAIGVGIIGFGLAGAILHTPVIEAVDDLRIVAVSTSRAEEVARRLPDATAVAAPEALIADERVDLVVIASPNDSHAPLARAALMAGKHVVIDKPFVIDVAEGEALIALATERGLMLTVFHNRRWDGDFLTARDVLASGVLGHVARAEFHWDRMRPAIKPSWREEAAVGSGILADLGPHLIDQALLMFGWPDSITADVLAQREGARADDMFTLTLAYGTRRVVLASSALIAAPRPRFALYGTKGAYVKYGLDPQEAVLRAEGSAVAPGFGEEEPAAFGTLADADGRTERVPTQAGCWVRFYQGVAASIRAGAPAPVDPADAVAGLQLIAAARQSANEGRTIALHPRAALSG